MLLKILSKIILRNYKARLQIYFLVFVLLSAIYLTRQTQAKNKNHNN